MEIKREFLYEGQQASVILTDDSQTAREYGKQGICCIGISNEDAFFEGAWFVVTDPEEADEHLLSLAWCRFNHIPYVVFRTDNLLCRESIDSDYDELKKLTEGLEDIRFPSRDVFKAYTENAYNFWGYGVWTILYKAGDEWQIAGWIGIMPPEEDNPPDLGFVIRRDLRGRGLAKRACSKIIEYAKENLGMENMTIRTGKENEAAKALARSLGFSEVTETDGKFTAVLADKQE